VSKGSYPYPEDEFDVPDDHGGPRGVHRAPRSGWSKLWPFLVVIVVLPALAYGLVTWFFNSGGSIPEGLGGTSTTLPEDPTDTSTETTAPDGTTPAVTPTTPPTAEAPPAPAADFTLPVAVQNAAKISGLAAKKAKVLTDGGFTKVTPSNSAGTGVTDSTVFYATDAQKVTADAVAKLLSITKVTQSSTQAKNGITVVLKSDPTG